MRISLPVFLFCSGTVSLCIALFLTLRLSLVSSRNFAVTNTLARRDKHDAVFPAQCLDAMSVSDAAYDPNSPPNWVSRLIGWVTEDHGWVQVVRSNAYHPSRRAHFGPRLSSDGALCGFLASMEDMEQHHHQKSNVHALGANQGCSDASLPNGDDNNDNDEYAQQKLSKDSFIALIQRGGCPFTTKVRNAQALGASGVIVGDDVEHAQAKNPWGFWGDSNSLVGMWGSGDTSDIKIPSVFVSYESYVDLLKLYQDENRPHHTLSMSKIQGLEIIMNENESAEWPLTPLLLVLLFLPSLITFCTLLIHRIRLRRQQKRERAKPEEIAKLPWVHWGEWPSHYSSRYHSMTQPEKTPTSPNKTPTAATPPTLNPAQEAAYRLSSSPPSDIENGLVSIPETTLWSRWTRWVSPTTALTPAPFGGNHRPSFAAQSSLCNNTIPPSTSPVPYTPFLVMHIEPFDECAICLSTFLKGDPVRVLPCWHVFHVSEVDEWLESGKGVCPTCRNPISSPLKLSKSKSPTSPSAVNMLQSSSSASSSSRFEEEYDDETPRASDTPRLNRDYYFSSQHQHHHSRPPHLAPQSPHSSLPSSSRHTLDYFQGSAPSSSQSHGPSGGSQRNVVNEPTERTRLL